jgi:choline dehydrogenase
MITVYPHDSDWDKVSEITGDSSWNGTAMRHDFQRVERNRYLDKNDPDEAAGHGFDVWLQVERFSATSASRTSGW